MATFYLNRRELNRAALAGLGGLMLGTSASAYQEPDTAVAPELADQPTLPFVDGSFTIAALPDTQVYCEKYPEHFYKQTEWLAANKARYDIQFVVHLGDITNRNTDPQWEVAAKAMHALDEKVPYSLVVGNHDCGPGGNATTRDTSLNDYFPLDVARKQPTFGGVMDDTRLENSYHTFSARGHNFLILALEWGPRDEVVQWADEVVGRHREHLVILTTHAYMYFDDTRYDWSTRGTDQRWNPHSYGTAMLPGGTNDGQQLWDKLISKHPNFFMTINGHVLEDGLGRLTTTRPDANAVHQLLVNYQMKEQGGQGYMRLIEFLPDGKTVQVKAFSPATGQYKIDPQNEFTLELDPAWKMA